MRFSQLFGHTLAISLCTCWSLAMAHAETTLKEPATAADQQLVSEIQRQLGACFTTVGVQDTFPVIAQFPADKELAIITLMPQTGPRISDSYHYTLAIDKARKQLYIKQIGGIGGLQKVFGPIKVGTTCQPKS